MSGLDMYMFFLTVSVRFGLRKFAEFGQNVKNKIELVRASTCEGKVMNLVIGQIIGLEM